MTSQALLVNGRYRIVRRLGAGGMGEVHLAHDLHQGGRPVALKVLRPSLLDAGALERFRDEFRSMARLRHPNLAEVFDFGTVGSSGAPFLTMEYIEGHDLSTLTPQQARERFDDLVVQCLRALDYIHWRGFLHNDIKPQNILIAEPFQVKLLDFGLAQPRHGKPQPGVSGTLHYVAPERLANRPTDARSDLYGLGAVLFEMLTGRPPFDAADPGRIVTAILQGGVPSLRSINPEIPEAMEAFVIGLLAVRPEDRPASAGAALARWQIGQVSPQPLDTPETVASFITSSDLVGRKEEFSALRRFAMAHAQPGSGTSPAPRMVLVSAPAGAGKSRLLREVRQELQLRGVRTLAIRAHESGGSALQPFTELLRPRRDDPGLAPELLDAISQALGDPETGGASRRRTARLGKAELMTRLGACLDHLPGEGPGVLFIEDLQWADAPAIDLIRHLVLRSDRSRWQMIGSLRHAGSGGKAPIDFFMRRFGEHSEPQHLKLEPLSLTETEQLLGTMLPWDSPPGALAHRLHESSSGNPLILEELLKSLIAEGHVMRRGERWGVAPGALKRLPLPPGLAELVLRQVQGLAADDAFAVRLLAVVAKPTSLTVLCAALNAAAPGGWTDRRAQATGESLRRLKLVSIDVREDGVSLVCLTQTGVRDAIYDSLPPEERRRLHAAAGHALEAGGQGAIDEIVEDLARHFSAAGERDTAAQYLLLAAARAGNLFDPVRQAGFLRQALDLLPETDTGRRLAALDELTFALLQELGEHRAGLELARQLEEIAHRAGNHRLESRALRQQGWALSFLGDASGALALMRRALALARAHGDAHETAASLAYQGMVLSRRGDPARARVCLDEAVTLARPARDPQTLSWILNNAALCHLGLGDTAAAGRLLEEALRIARRLGLMGSYHHHLSNSSTVRRELGDLQGAITAAEQALEWSRRHTCLDLVAMQSESLAEACALAGLVERAIRALEESASARRQSGEAADSTYRLDLLGHCARTLGRYALAQEHHQAGLEMARQRGDRVQEGYLLAASAADLLAGGDPTAAGELARAAGDLGTSLDHPRIVFLAERTLGLLAIETGDRRSVAGFRRSLRQQNERPLRFEDRLERLRVAARLAIADEDLRSAQAAARDGLRMAKRSGAREFEWQFHALLARIMENRGLPDRALTAYRAAQSVIRSVVAGIEESAMRDDYTNQPERQPIARLAAGDKEHEQGIAHPPAAGIGSGLPVAASASPSGAGADAPARMLTTLFEITQIINTIHDPRELLDKVMDLAIELVGAERGLIFLPHGETEEMEPVVARNVERRTIRDATAYSRSILREAGRGRSILSHDAGHDARFKEYRSVAQYGIRSLMCVPLHLKGRTIGTVYVDTRAPGTVFTPDSLRFLEAFAAQAAVAVENAHLFDQVKQENETLRQAMQERYGFGSIIGRSSRMRDVFGLLTRVAPSALPVMIRGESGTGKELVARAIHQNSPRRDRPFFSENCAALPDTLLESELFGHVKGAFTGAESHRRGLFEMADGGTLFLDEIGDTSLALQSKLLRVLQNGEIRPLGSETPIRVNVRVLSATNRDLESMIREKKFREDLYYRLKGVTITLPALRERREDIPLLIHHFLAKLAQENESPRLRIDAPLMAHLARQNWPGNVRELENQIYRLALYATNGVITMEDARHDLEADAALMTSPQRSGTSPLNRTLIRQALASSKGNRNDTARLLGISRATLFRKLRELGLDVPSQRGRPRASARRS